MYIDTSPPVQKGHTARLISKEKYAGTCNTQSFQLRYIYTNYVKCFACHQLCSTNLMTAVVYVYLW
jgi:hypothetical protein